MYKKPQEVSGEQTLPHTRAAPKESRLEHKAHEGLLVGPLIGGATRVDFGLLASLAPLSPGSFEPRSRIPISSFVWKDF